MIIPLYSKSIFLLSLSVLYFKYSHAASQSPNPIPIATHYTAFGPLPYVTERGSSPLKSLHSSILSTLLSLTSFPSESAVGGFASWRDCPLNETAPHKQTCPFPDADPTLPYQIWALANFTIRDDPGHSHVLQCTDHAVIQVVHPHPQFQSIISQNPSLTTIQCPSDVYGDGRSLCPVRLFPGSYRIFVTTASHANHTQFECNYFRDPTSETENPLLPIDDSVTPDIVITRTPFAARLAGKHISVTLQNLHPIQWATAGSARLVDAPDGIRLAPHATSDSHFPLPRIAPRQVRQLRIDLLTDTTFLASVTDLPNTIQLSVAVSYDFVPDTSYETIFNLTLDVTKWRRSRSYHFTYVDVDGSIQAAAVLPPKNPCTGSPTGDDECPVLLSTHGAGVDAIGHAWTDSYKTQNQSWILLPTGRRKYGLNWEGPQMKSAITALKVLAENLPGVPPEQMESWKVRPDMWLQAGHSMGGHGALLLATHYPDMLLGALPAMGWLRLSSYGGMHYVEQLSYSDASSRSLLTVASAEYSADLYAENLLGIPFLARVGSVDQSVPPSELRKFSRLLKENEYFHNFSSSYVSLNEVEGKGHWFDGVVDDDVLQRFISKHLTAAARPRLPQQFSVFTINPASTGSRGGLQILSLEVVFQTSRLLVTRDSPGPGTWRIETENVRRFRYRPVPGLLDRPQSLVIDGATQPILISSASLDRSNKYVDFCAHPISSWSKHVEPDTRAVNWRSCRDTSSWGKERSRERGPDNSGPSFQVLAERKVIVVYPEGDLEFQDSAVVYSNALYLRGISVQVTPDSEVSVGQLTSADDANIILLGGPGMNRMAKKYYEDGFSADVTFDEHQFCIAQTKCYAKPGSGIAFLSGGRKRTLLFYVAGTDRDGVLAAMSFLPRSPASNVPEWVVVSKERGWGFRGLGGVVGLGYWDYEWKLEPRKSYPPEFVLDAKQAGMTCAVAQKKSSLLSWPVILLVALCVCFAIGVWRCRQRASLRSPRYEEVEKNEPQDSSPDPSVSTATREKEALLLMEGQALGRLE